MDGALGSLLGLDQSACRVLAKGKGGAGFDTTKGGFCGVFVKRFADLYMYLVLKGEWVVDRVENAARESGGISFWGK